MTPAGAASGRSRVPSRAASDVSMGSDHDMVDVDAGEQDAMPDVRCLADALDAPLEPVGLQVCIGFRI